jgi:hypothetical protein
MKHKVESTSRMAARYLGTPNRTYLFHTTEVVPDGTKVTVEWETPDVHECPELEGILDTYRIGKDGECWVYYRAGAKVDGMVIDYCPACGKKL